MQILNRNEMKNIMAGSSGSGCGPFCSGCIPDNTSHGDCIEWECRDGDHCVPVTSDCCVNVGTA